jgi:hypothetical protein
MTQQVRFFDEKKYLWDRGEYDSEEKARAKEEEYARNGFDVRVWREEGRVLLYTRRVVGEVVIEDS